MKNANPLCHHRWFTTFAFAVAVLGGVCGCVRKEAHVVESAPKSVAEFFEIRVGEKSVRAQIAVRDSEMQRGLMERQNIGANEGMLFVYARAQRMSFWMRNTPTPLDIGFFDRTGKLLEIYPLHPFDERGVSSTSDQLLIALEMNQGWFASNGVKPGAQLNLKSLSAALKARGFKPEDFGLPLDGA